MSPDQKKILTAKENFSLEKKKNSHNKINILTVK